jgi:hypothetical protein
LGPELTDGKEHDSNADLVATILPRGSLRVADLGYFKLLTLARLDRMGVFWLSRFQTKCSFLDADGQVWELDAFLCEWTVYVTNAPVELLSLAEAFVIGKLRWQIELVFKLWKSHLLIDEWRSKKPWRILCEVYAKLIGALLQHWILVVTGWKDLDRSLVKATRTIRTHIGCLARSLLDLEKWKEVLSVLQGCLERGCRLYKRKSIPSSFQLLFKPELLGLA